MKSTLLVSLLFGRHALKIFALIIGYSFWLALAGGQNRCHTLTIPVTIYRANGTRACQTHVHVKVFGLRSLILEAIDTITPINVSQVDQATTVIIEPDAINVPGDLKIIDYHPHAFTLTPTCGRPAQKSASTPEIQSPPAQHANTNVVI